MAMNMHRLKNTILSYPVPVTLAGFRSTTLELQQAGWQLSMEQNISYQSPGSELRLAIKHEGLGLVGISQTYRLEYEHLAHLIMDNGGGEQAVSRSIYFEVAYLSPNIQFRILPARHMPAFQPIDARPEFHAEREVDLTDIALFKPVNVSEDFEVYLNKKDEAEILDLLLKKQDPKQKEIREARRHRAWREVHNPAAETGSGFDVYGDIKRQLVIVA